MKLKNVVPLLKTSETLPQAYVFYGHEDFVTLKSTMIRLFLNARFEKLQYRSLETLEEKTTLSLFEVSCSNIFLKTVKQLPDDIAFLKEKNDFYFFLPKRFNQKSSFFQKYASDPNIAFIACYDTSFHEMTALLSAIKITLDQSSLSFLEGHFQLHPSALLEVIEKLPYLDAFPTRETLHQLMPRESATPYHDLIDAFFSPFEIFQNRLSILSFQDTDFIPFSRVFLGACQKLHNLLLQLKAGIPLRTALFALRFPLFFDKEPFFTKALNRNSLNSFPGLYEDFFILEENLMQGNFQSSALINTLITTHHTFFKTLKS